MRYFLDLFAGIGGFALGAEWAGVQFDAHYFSEVDEYAIKVYRARFPDAIPLGDIRAITGANLPQGDWIIAGGFPCQDISVAGKGAGLAGKRSGLWYEYARLIVELRPRYAIMENVGALTFRGLDAVLGSLAEIGYDAEWQDIRASDVGAPHRRERIWIVAYPGSSRAWSEGGEACTDRRRGTWRDESTLRQEYGEDGADRLASAGSLKGAMVDPDGERREKQLDGFAARTRDADGKPCREAMADASDGRDVRRDGELEPTQGQMREHRGSPQDGRRQWWATEPDVGRVAYGVPSRVDRLKCLGNSIVPQIAERIFKQILDYEEGGHL